MSEDKSVRSVRRKAKARQARTNGILQQQAQRIPKQSYQHLKFTDRVAFNNLAEEQFVELLRRLIAAQQTGTYPILGIYQEAAFELKISPETVKRYLFKHSASRAEFRSWQDLVMLNPNYVPPDGDVPPADGEGEEQEEADK